jgi:hypothetical protein
MEVFMRYHSKQYTEPIFSRLADYRAQLNEHPCLVAARKGSELPKELLCEFAFHQYSDSILWIPMLSQMKSKATRSLRLCRAIEDNIRHEAGLGSISHVTLAVALMRSLGIVRLDAFPTQTFTQSASLWLSDAFAAFSEPEIAGFLLTAETLVPEMFAAFLPSFVTLGCDTRYFREHIAVDADEHAMWMTEAVAEVVELHGEACVDQIVAGMEDAWQETREVPDALWGRRCASH